MKTNYKPGDRVRLTKNPFDAPVGTIGTVRAVSARPDGTLVPYPLTLTMPDGEKDGPYALDEVEPAPAAFKVGDRVKRTGPHLANGGTDYGCRECEVGWEGVVRSLYRDGAEVSVKWDLPKKNGFGETSRIVATSLSAVPTPAFKVGDRVQRTGPHIASGYDYGDAECKVGDVGTVRYLYGDGDVSVTWDRTGRGSAIASASLSPAPASARSRFKAGDRVRILPAPTLINYDGQLVTFPWEDADGADRRGFVGESGVVIAPHTGQGNVEVRIETGPKRGRWFIAPLSLDLITTPPPAPAAPVVTPKYADGTTAKVGDLVDVARAAGVFRVRPTPFRVTKVYERSGYLDVVDAAGELVGWDGGGGWMPDRFTPVKASAAVKVGDRVRIVETYFSQSAKRDGETAFTYPGLIGATGVATSVDEFDGGGVSLTLDTATEGWTSIRVPKVAVIEAAPKAAEPTFKSGDLVVVNPGAKTIYGKTHLGGKVGKVGAIDTDDREVFLWIDGETGDRGFKFDDVTPISKTASDVLASLDKVRALVLAGEAKAA